MGWSKKLFCHSIDISDDLSLGFNKFLTNVSFLNLFLGHPVNLELQYSSSIFKSSRLQMGFQMIPDKKSIQGGEVIIDFRYGTGSLSAVNPCVTVINFWSGNNTSKWHLATGRQHAFWPVTPTWFGITHMYNPFNDCQAWAFLQGLSISSHYESLLVT